MVAFLASPQCENFKTVSFSKSNFEIIFLFRFRRDQGNESIDPRKLRKKCSYLLSFLENLTYLCFNFFGFLLNSKKISHFPEKYSARNYLFQLRCKMDVF